MAVKGGGRGGGGRNKTGGEQEQSDKRGQESNQDTQTSNRIKRSHKTAAGENNMPLTIHPIVKKKRNTFGKAHAAEADQQGKADSMSRQQARKR